MLHTILNRVSLINRQTVEKKKKKKKTKKEKEKEEKEEEEEEEEEFEPSVMTRYILKQEVAYVRCGCVFTSLLKLNLHNPSRGISVAFYLTNV